MDYKKIFNEANLEKQEESLSRMNECGGAYGGGPVGGCGGGYYSSSSYSSRSGGKFTPNAIFKHLSSLKKFANVDRKYMKGWCTRNAYYCDSTGDATKRFERALKDKEAREQAAATKKANIQAIMDTFGVDENQITAAKRAMGYEHELEEAERELASAQNNYDKILSWVSDCWEKAGGFELWEKIKAAGFKF